MDSDKLIKVKHNLTNPEIIARMARVMNQTGPNRSIETDCAFCCSVCWVRAPWGFRTNSGSDSTTARICGLDGLTSFSEVGLNMCMHDPTDSISLVEWVEGRGFKLSDALLHVVGPIYGECWEVKALVSHIISHFDDPLEHLLDGGNPDDPRFFDVDADQCQSIAERYVDEFLDLPPAWYIQLYRWKLLSLKVPTHLVHEAKMAFLISKCDIVSFSKALSEFLRDRRLSLSPHIVRLLASPQSHEEDWLQLEELVKHLLDTGACSGDDIYEWLEGD